MFSCAAQLSILANFSRKAWAEVKKGQHPKNWCERYRMTTEKLTYLTWATSPKRQQWSVSFPRVSRTACSQVQFFLTPCSDDALHETKKFSTFNFAVSVSWKLQSCLNLFLSKLHGLVVVVSKESRSRLFFYLSVQWQLCLIQVPDQPYVSLTVDEGSVAIFHIGSLEGATFGPVLWWWCRDGQMRRCLNNVHASRKKTA